jgi:hypothetical protein
MHRGGCKRCNGTVDTADCLQQQNQKTRDKWMRGVYESNGSRISNYPVLDAKTGRPRTPVTKV